VKQKLIIFLALIFLLITLIGLNAASYVQKEKIPDSEIEPNRSTYNTGATGTRAFYDLLAETGRKVKRFQEPFPSGGRFDATEFSTFVIIGRTRREIDEDEITYILDWVSAGGTLVVIDREPPKDLISTTANWSISQELSKNIILNIDPSNQKKMIGETEAVKPILPTILTNNVNAVQPSQFASSIKISRLYNTEADSEEDDEFEEENDSQPPPPIADEESKENSGIGSGEGNSENDELFATPTQTPLVEAEEYPQMSLVAPVIHLANKRTNLLVDFPFGAGQIIYLSDPYIVANGGINLVDNAKLGINIVGSRGGIIAFDEYHQGFGNNENRLLEYFSGTPVAAIFLQLFLIIGLIFYSQSRRFARALPDDEPNRLSKLEYVSAMAQLQQQTKAYDLAIENIYKEFRRRVSRLVGIDNHTATREDIAEKVAERTDYKAKEITELLFKCEDIIHGEPTKKKEIVDLISRIREVENALGLRRGKNRNS
jgi:hypothetical protein